MPNNISCIILAAGKSTRMKSQTPKVLHPLCARPMLGYVVDLVKALKASKSIAVLGYKYELVNKALPSGMQWVRQKKLLGTADALKCALPRLKNFNGTILVLYGDTVLLQPETVKKLLRYHHQNNSDATLLTAVLDKPEGYGRILRDKYSAICGIAEEKDADDFQKNIKEINTGIVCFKKKSLIRALRLVRANNRKKEFYLTDAISIIYKKGGLVDAVKIPDINEALGINSRAELAKAGTIMQQRINQELMQKGVSIVDPASAFIAYGTKIGQDSVIYPFTVIERDVTIGSRCQIGPFAHLREGTRLADDTLVGNFIEITRSKLGKGTIAKHFCYLGDARVGKRVNIGAGTVTANFDGKRKQRTVIKDNTLIGSDTIIVAPVKIGKGSATGAGTVVISDVADKKTVVGVPAREIKFKG